MNAGRIEINKELDSESQVLDSIYNSVAIAPRETPGAPVEDIMVTTDALCSPVLTHAQDVFESKEQYLIRCF